MRTPLAWGTAEIIRCKTREKKAGILRPSLPRVLIKRVNKRRARHPAL
jgi:hypothetical protein